MKRRRVRNRLFVLLAVAVVSLIVDQTTGDTTGPPYHDSLLNRVAFFMFFGFAVAFVIVGAASAVVWMNRRLRNSS